MPTLKAGSTHHTFTRVFAALFGRVDSGEISRGSSTAAAVIANTISCSVVSDLQSGLWASELAT